MVATFAETYFPHLMAPERKTGSSRYGARRQVAAAEERETAAVRLVWVNTTIREAPSREREPGASRMFAVVK